LKDRKRRKKAHNGGCKVGNWRQKETNLDNGDKVLRCPLSFIFDMELGRPRAIIYIHGLLTRKKKLCF
jgi:hypothetical protein